MKLTIFFFIFISVFVGFSTSSEHSSAENKTNQAMTSSERRQHFQDVSDREADEVLALLAQTPKPEDFLSKLRRIMTHYEEINLKVDEIMSEVPKNNEFSHEKILSA